MDNGASSYHRFCDRGDDNALAELIRLYRDGLIFYLYSIVGNIHIAEEIAEDTFVLLGTKKPKDKGNGTFKTWLYTIGRNLAVSYLRKQAKRQEISIDDCLDLADETESMYEMLVAEQRKIMLHKAMSKLKTEYRQVLHLVYFEGFSNKEAATVMKRSVHNVETLLYRARKSLKTQLEREGFTYEEL